MRGIFKSLASAALVAALVVSGTSAAEASHAWGSYHWARQSNPFTLQLGDNMTTPEWKGILSDVSTDWNTPLGGFTKVLDTTITPGQGGRSCKASTGRVEVCNGRYGFNGWIGIAQIWISGTHITKGVAKMNDSYLNTSTYGGWKRYVTCQEIGHTFGLGHTSEDGSDQGTCMDYSGNNETPSAHDFQQLASIYSHLDTTTTVKSGATTGGKGNGNAPAWAPGFAEDGTPVGASPDRGRVYVTDLPWGERVITFVFWAHGH